jgi:hypothetical protein
VRRRRDEAIELRKCWRLARAEIGEQDAALFNDRVGFLLDVGAQIAGLGLGRRLQACPVDIQQPAVKRAAQPAVFEPPVSEVGAAVRAMPAEQSVASLVIPEGDEVFTHEPDRLYGAVAGELIDESGRLPIAPHQRAGRCARRRAGDEIVLLRAQHRGILLARASRLSPRRLYSRIQCPGTE